MRLSTRLSMLARLRVSTRLAALVLLVFALKIASAAACAKHDYADVRQGSVAERAAMVQAAPDSTDGGSASLDGAAACSHCDVHHAATLPAAAMSASTPGAYCIAVRGMACPPDPGPGEDLRPPIGWTT